MSSTSEQHPPADHLHDYKERENRRRDVFATIGLFLGVVILYARTVTFDFVNFDDGLYVFDNAVVRQGLTLEGVRWAFTTGLSGNWHPLTWLSHMLDVSLFGMTPGAHHAVNVVLHGINGVLCFVLLRLSTGRFWASAVGAALFAWHPLRVESVAWIAERKDVLSTLFWLGTMIAYVRYVQTGSWRHYAASLLLLTLGLMCKSMLVTLPFALLLWDAWPLRRLGTHGTETPRQLVLEKLPMLAVCGIIAWVTIRMQAASGAVTTIETLSLAQRLGNALASYLDYIRLSFMPVGLAVFYPNPYFEGGTGIPVWKLALAGLVLLGVSIAALTMRRRAPAFVVGWFWFLGTLVPVIGVVQVGSQAMAERYSYVPSIGLSMAVVWTAALLLSRRLAVVASVAALCAVSMLTIRQVGFWRDTEAVMTRAASVVPNNTLALTNLGALYDERGDTARAEYFYRAALRITPADAICNNNLGGFLVATGRPAEAIPLLERAVSRKPDYVAAHVALGDAMELLNDWPRAEPAYRRALEIEPADKNANHHYALALARRGQIDDAIKRWRVALTTDRSFVPALDGCGRALIMNGEVGEGRQLLRSAIAARPEAHATMYVLAWSLATDPRTSGLELSEANRLAQEAQQLRPNNPLYADAYAAALARVGEFAKAEQLASHAADTLRRAGDAKTADAIADRAKLYAERRPYLLTNP